MRTLATAALMGLGIGLSSATYADTFFGLYVGGGTIDYDMSGDFTDLENGGSTIDFEDDLDLSGDTGSYFYIAVEHGIPILPNVRFARSEIDESAATTLSQAITFDGETFFPGTPIVSTLDLTHNDYTFYYEVLDNWVSLDIGLTARQFDGELTASSRLTTRTASQDLDFVAPLIYGSAQFDLPLTGLYAGVQGNWIGVGDAQLYDFWAKLGYTFKFGLGLEAGMRTLGAELDDVEDIDADITLDGTYIAATFHF